jgi:ribosomal protein L7Ae-like RNA K-turn-binding protein
LVDPRVEHHLFDVHGEDTKTETERRKNKKKGKQRARVLKLSREETKKNREENEGKKDSMQYLQQADVVLLAQSGDQLDVLLLIARLSQDAQVGFTAVQSLDALLQAAGQTVVNQGLLQHLDDGLLEGHGLLLFLLLGDLLDDLLDNFLTADRNKHNVRKRERGRLDCKTCEENTSTKLAETTKTQNKRGKNWMEKNWKERTYTSSSDIIASDGLPHRNCSANETSVRHVKRAIGSGEICKFLEVLRMFFA